MEEKSRKKEENGCEGDKEGREEFERKLGNLETGNEMMLNQWEGLKNRIRKVLREVESLRVSENGERNRKGWWDEECWKRRRGVRKKLREWRNRGWREVEYKVR